MAPHQDTQTRSRLSIGEDGPSDSALAAARDGRLRRPAAERHAARCASRVLCSGGAPWRYSPSKVKSPQTNGIVERFPKTILNEFYRITFRKKIYSTLTDLQADLDAWLREYNEERVHQGRWCYGRPPMQTFLDTIPLAKEKLLAA